MRKYWGVVIGFVLCLLLTACGGTKTETITSDIIVHLSVNPEFEIGINSEGVVESVTCLNDDAKAVYADMSLSGLEYQAAISQLLTAIKDGGFLQEGDTIEISVKQVPEISIDITETLDEVVSDFATNVMPVEVEMSSTVVDVNAVVSNKNTAELTYQYKIWMYCDEDKNADMTIYTDANQVITYVDGDDASSKSVVEKANVNGMSLEQGYKTLLDTGYLQGIFSSGRGLDIIVGDTKSTHDLYAQLSAWAAEYCLKSGNSINWYVLKNDTVWEIYSGEYTEMNGSWVMLSTYENGILMSIVKTAKDGSKEEYRYEAKDVLSYEYKLDVRQNGAYAEIFYEFGKMKRYISKDSSGNFIDKKFSIGERPSEEYRTMADGSQWNIVYYGNGVIKQQTYTLADGSYHESQYRENGSAIRRYTKKADGSISESGYNDQDICIYYHIENADGGYSVWYDDAGNIVRDEIYGNIDLMDIAGGL